MSDIKTHPISRRSVLRQGSYSLALPLLSSFTGAASEVSDTNIPKRMIFMGGGYGFTGSYRDQGPKYDFYPAKAGKFSDIGFTKAMMPLKKHQNDITMVSNLTNLGANNPHGGSFGYLNAGAYRTHEQSVSCDQVAGATIGKNNRFTSLVLTSREPIPGGGAGHGAGYSLSHDTQGKSIPGIASPIQLYKTLFAQKGDSSEKLIARLKKRQSILDIVRINGSNMQHTLAREDQFKLEEYFESIRRIELAIQREGEWAEVPKAKAPFEVPNEGLSGIKEIKLMLDMLILALQTDMTRIGTYRLPVCSLISDISIPSTPHQLSHYGSDPAKQAQSQQRDTKIMEIYSWFIDRLKETKDQDNHRLFDSCIVNYGSNLRTGHGTRNIPTILTGGGAKGITHGHHVILPEEDTSLANYWLTLLQQAGVKTSRFHYSTDIIPELLT